MMVLYKILEEKQILKGEMKTKQMQSTFRKTMV